MPIKGLSERHQMSRLGKIRLGVTVQPQGGKSYPRATDHFVVPEAVAATLPRDGVWCRCKDGEGPRVIPVMLPSDNPDVILPQFYKMYKSAGLWCSGNGEIARRWSEQGKLEELACPCPYLDSGDCGASATLNVVMPDVPGIGVWQIDTSNTRSIVALNSAFRDYAAAFGGLRGIPFLLRLEPQAVPRWDEKQGKLVSSTIYCMRLDTPYTMRQIVEFRASAGKVVEALMPPSVEDEPQRALPAPAEDPWDVSVCYAAAARHGVDASAYERYFEAKYGRKTADHTGRDVEEERAMYRGLESDPDRARRFANYACSLGRNKRSAEARP